MKRFFILFFLVIFLCFSTIKLSSCSKNEIEKISKNLSTYTISAILDDDKMEMTGIEKLRFVNSTGCVLDSLYFHLYPKAFREGSVIKPYSTLSLATCFPNGISYGDIEILSAKTGECLLNYEIVGDDEDILKVNLKESLENKKTVEIELAFNLKIPNCTHRFGYYNSTITLGNWYPILCYFHDGNFDLTPYYATGDPFVSEVSNYSVELVCKNDYVVSSTGKFEEKIDGKNKKVEINADAVRDCAIILNKNASKKSVIVGKTEISYVGYVGDNDLSLNLDVAKNAFSYFSSAFGEYPYSNLIVAKSPFIYGGMEYPELVLVSDSTVDEIEFMKVIVHEIAHQWWYAVVGNDQINEAWLDESLTEFSTALFFKHNEKYGVSYKELVSDAVESYALFVDVIETLRGNANTKMNLRINEYQNDYEYSYMIYVKGVIMFDSLSDALGEKKMLAGFRKYFDDNKFKVATKKDFLDAFESACHKDLEEFFNGYLNGTTIITSVN